MSGPSMFVRAAWWFAAEVGDWLDWLLDNPLTNRGSR